MSAFSCLKKVHIYNTNLNILLSFDCIKVILKHGLKKMKSDYKKLHGNSLIGGLSDLKSGALPLELLGYITSVE